MTTLNYVLMLVGFGLWYYAGYTRGKTKVRIKERKGCLVIYFDANLFSMAVS